MFSDPQFWVLIAFIIFIGVMIKPVRKILSINLDVKIQEIKDSIDQAEKIKNDAQLTLSEVKKRQNEVKAEIDLIEQEAKEKITMIEKNAHSKLTDQINKRNALASVKIDQMTRDANTEIQKHITQIAISATVNFLEKKLNDKEKQNIVNKSVNELGSALKN
jgi:F-type H+-transporting ATPase subunit b